MCILNLHSVCKWVLRGRVRNREFRPGLWGHRRNSVPSPMARRGGDLWLCSMRRDDLLFLHGVPTMAHGHACLHPPWSWLPATRQDGLRAWTIREGSGHRMSLTHTEYDFYATKCLTHKVQSCYLIFQEDWEHHLPMDKAHQEPREAGPQLWSARPSVHGEKAKTCATFHNAQVC